MTQVKISYDNGKYSCNIDGNTFKTAKKDYIEYMYKKITGVKLSYEEIVGTAPEKVNDKYGINQRFDFVEKLVKMVASGTQASAVITGQGGLGKSYTVMKTLEAAGYKDISDLASFETGSVLNMAKCFTTVKGYSTAKGM